MERRHTRVKSKRSRWFVLGTLGILVPVALWIAWSVRPWQTDEVRAVFLAGSASSSGAAPGEEDSATSLPRPGAGTRSDRDQALAALLSGTGRVEVEAAQSAAERGSSLRECSGVILFEAGRPADEHVRLLLDGRELELADDGSFLFRTDEELVELDIIARYYYLGQPVLVEPAKQSFVRLEPLAGGRVRGELVHAVGDRDLDGRPTDARVELVVIRGLPPARHAVLEASLEGNRTFDLGPVPPGSQVQLQFTSLRMRPIVERIDRIPAASAVWITVAPPEGVRVTGRVTDQNGFGRSLVRVRARVVDDRGPGDSGSAAGQQDSGGASSSRGGQPDEGGVGGARLREQWTAADGSFDLRGIAPGRIVIEAAPRGFIPSSVELGRLWPGDHSRDALLTLYFGATLSGTAYLDGRPASIVRVRAQLVGNAEGNSANGAAGDARTVRTSMSGEFKISGLPDGDWIVLAEDRQSDGRQVVNWSGLGGPVRLQGQFAHVGSFSLERVADLELDVYSRGMELPARIAVQLERHVPGTELWLPSSASGSKAVGLGGVAALEGLAAGSWRVTVDADGLRGTRSVALMPGELRRVRVALAPVQD